MSNYVGWIGVDLDGTLAEYFHWEGPGHIGEPIGPMIERVKEWLNAGVLVKIFTARVAKGNPGRAEALEAISRWTRQVFGQEFEVTAEKDWACDAIYDDRAYRVETNTGRVLDDPEKREYGELDFDNLVPKQKLIYKIWSCMKLGHDTKSMTVCRMGPEEIAQAVSFLDEYEAQQ